MIQQLRKCELLRAFYSGRFLTFWRPSNLSLILVMRSNDSMYEIHNTLISINFSMETLGHSIY